ncbi:MAG: hypothetical protein ABW167_05940 [Baekduia sp.]
MAALVMIGGAGGVAQAADACPNAAIRAQQHAEHLAHCGAYEMVSPPEKNGGAVLFTPTNQTGLTALSADGDRAVFASYTSFADSRSGMPASYVAHRTASGWESNVASPPPAKPTPDLITGGDAAVWQYAAADLSFGITATMDTFDPGDASPLSYDLYRVGIGETPSLITQGNSGPVPGYSEFSHLAADGAVYFRTTAHLVPGDANRTAGMDVYVRAGGQTSLLSRKGDGTAVGTCGAILGNLTSLQGTTAAGAISNGGSSVVFTTPDPNAFGADPDCSAPAHIYAARSGGQTLDVSASQRSTPDPAGPMPARYAGATPDGSRIFFQSSEMLTNDAQPGGGLYEYDAGTGTLGILLSAGGVQPRAMSNDATKIYFLSSEDLAAGGLAGMSNVYVIDTTTKEVDHVVADPTNSIVGDFDVWQSAANPVGDFAFGSTARLTAFDNAGFAEVYMYKAQSKELICVSCDPAGQRLLTSKARSNATIRPGVVLAKLEPSFSADGKRLVFQSGDQLVPEDTNHTVDVYAYEDGRLSLVSSGRGDQGSYLVGISSDGRVVAFTTSDALIAEDQDNGDVDMYVARSDGGFPSAGPERAPARCVGDACQDGPSRQPGVPSAGSVGFVGSGDLAEPFGTGVARAVSAKGSVSGRAAKVKVRVPGAGSIVLSGSSIESAQRAVTRSATYTLTASLTAKARRQLVARGSLKVAITVRFAPKEGQAVVKRLSLTFKQKAKKRSAPHAASRRASTEGGR